MKKREKKPKFVEYAEMCCRFWESKVLAGPTKVEIFSKDFGQAIINPNFCAF